MTVQQRKSFIKALALDISKEYKKEGLYLKPADSYDMACEAVDEMEEDFN